MKIRSIENLSIDSKRLCCNFVNTVFTWKGDDDYDYFNSYGDFIEWCKKLEIYTPGYLNKLGRIGDMEPSKATQALRKIKDVRTLLHQVISSIASHDVSKYSKLLNKINPNIQNALSHKRLEVMKGKFTTSFQTDSFELMSPVWVILDSLNMMLLEDDMDRIKECPTCGFVFLDETKNGKRIWCNPLNCGTKDKMERYNRRRKRI